MSDEAKDKKVVVVDDERTSPATKAALLGTLAAMVPPSAGPWVLTNPNAPSGFFPGLPGIRPKRERLATKCSLPGCDEMTTHNGGYCCGEHCKEHRRRQKEGT